MHKSKLFKSFFSLFVALGLVLSFVGCVEPAVTKYNVTFELEGKNILVVEVEKGKTLTSDQLPTNPEKEGYEFVGWFNGDTKFDGQVVVESDMTFQAKFEEIPSPEVYTIEFVVDGQVIKTVQVEDGSLVDVALVPADPTKKAFEFVGWFDEENEFQEQEKVVGNARYEAKFTRSHYIVNFVNGESTSEVLVSVGAALTNEDIPTPVVTGLYFSGWYSESTVAQEGLVLEEDTTFVAKFVNLESFDGIWYNEDGVYFVIKSGKVSGGTFGEKGVTFEFDSTSGKLTYSSSGLRYNKHFFEVTLNGVNYIHSYYDDIEEDIVNDSYELALAQESKYQGSYRSNNSSFIEIIAGGVVTKYDGSTTATGIITEVDGKLVIKYSMSSSSAKIVEVTVDEMGSIVAEGKIYIKGSTEYSYIYLSNNPTYNFFKVGEETIVTVKDGAETYYGSLDGVVEVGSIINITYNEKTVTLKVTGNTSYVLSGSEAGTYTSGENTMELDGFGNALLNGNKIEYVLNGLGYIITTNGAYVLNKTENTYTVLEKDSVNNGKYIYNSNNKYTLVLDGFGGVTLTYAVSYGETEYLGKYVLSGNKLTISDCNYYANGTWTIEEDGKILVNNDKLYLLEGATFTDVRKDMDGIFGENGEIVVNSSSNKITVLGVEYTLTYNYNGSKASYQVKHKDTNEYGQTAEFTDIITISLTNEGKLQVVTAYTTWDEYCEGPETTTSTVEYSKYVPATLDAFAGTWTGTTKAGVSMTYVINGDGTGTLNGTAITYKVSGNKLSFVYGGEDYTLTGDPTTGKLTATFTYDYEDMPSFEVSKQGEEKELDAFAGTWTGTTKAGVSMTYVINGDGTGTLNGTAITYKVSGNKLSFVYGGEDYTLTGDPTTGKLTATFTYDYEDMPSFEVSK